MNPRRFVRTTVVLLRRQMRFPVRQSHRRGGRNRCRMPPPQPPARRPHNKTLSAPAIAAAAKVSGDAAPPVAGVIKIISETPATFAGITPIKTEDGYAARPPGAYTPPPAKPARFVRRQHSRTHPCVATNAVFAADDTPAHAPPQISARTTPAAKASFAPPQCRPRTHTIRRKKRGENRQTSRHIPKVPHRLRREPGE